MKSAEKAVFLKNHPLCCFCGGVNPSQEIDHIPSRQLFLLRKRPHGMLFPACKICNQSSGSAEQVISMLSRIYPDNSGAGLDIEFQKILKGVNRSIPGLLEEMLPSLAQRLNFKFLTNKPEGASGVLNASGPLVNSSIRKFGYKLGCALHYMHTNNIVPMHGGIFIRWFTNYDHYEGKIPSELFSLLGEIKTLTQGTWEVGEQFSYSYVTGESRSIYVSAFSKSFLLVCIVLEDKNIFADSFEDKNEFELAKENFIAVNEWSARYA